MFDNNLLHLVFLHSSGMTHNDMKNIFLGKDIFNPISLWEDLISGKPIIDMPKDRLEKIIEKSKKVECEKIKTFLITKNIQIIHWFHIEYPERLKTIGHAPFFLYVRGKLRSDLPLIGVVGSRKNTTYAKRILDKILPAVIHTGVGVISGGANGVDSIAHENTLDNNGYTIAVFGTGIDRCYPAGNKTLFEKIITNNGAIISHFPLGTGPEIYNFPIRNEIVAALSNGILIPEAALSSGTLITAQLALEHGRDVFAIPGDIDRTTSEGTNMLIATGQAKCVRCAEDLLEEYFDISGIGSGLTPIIKAPPSFSNEEERKTYEAIEDKIQRVDDIVSHTGLSMTDTLISLAMLEIGGYIKLDEMGRYNIT